jgi:hypothetical protein
MRRQPVGPRCRFVPDPKTSSVIVQPSASTS